MDQEDQSTLCSECGNWPEDILILICNHNLCLPCASKNLLRESKKSEHTFQTVVWTHCGLATVLDPDSATTLLTMNHDEEEDSISSVPQTKNFRSPDTERDRDSFTRDLPKPAEHLRDTFQAPPAQAASRYFIYNFISSVFHKFYRL